MGSPPLWGVEHASLSLTQTVVAEVECLLQVVHPFYQWECLLQVFDPSYQWGVEHAILTLTVVAEVEWVVHPLLTVGSEACHLGSDCSG